MSWFNRFTSGARRLASNITDSVRRRVTDFGNWLTGYVGPDQTSQVLLRNTLEKIIRRNNNHSKSEKVHPL